MELILEDNQVLKDTKGLSIKYHLPIINAAVVEIKTGDYEALAAMPHIKPIYSNPVVNVQMNKARSVVNAENCTYTGEGITIASLDTGISPIDDFTSPENRITAFKDFINNRTVPYDDNGHGTHTCGIAVGNGISSQGKYRGIAPKANIISLKTLDYQGKGNATDVLAGMQWIYDNKEKYDIRIVNLSIGTGGKIADDPLVAASEALWESGIVVVTAAGNNGPAPGSISSPGISKKIITVGSSDDFNMIKISGTTLQNFSGRGPTAECVIKPDIVAPGTNIVSCLAPKSRKSENAKGNYISLSGTSMSTPLVSGAIALLLEKYPDLSPDDVKYMLKISCQSLDYPPNKQGWGLLNVEKLLSQEAQYVRK